ncbi:MAG: PUA domain-containing protein [Candidatus Nanoarchaeia archaeon]
MNYYSGKDKKSLISKLPEVFLFDKKDEIIEYNSILFKNKNHFLIILNDQSGVQYIPHLKSREIHLLKKIVIDTGAVPFLLKGADMMRPGIVEIDENIVQNEIILIVDEVKGLHIGVGRALYQGSEMREMKSGKVIKTIHYFKDSLYDVVL